MPAREMDLMTGVTVKSQGIYKQGPEKKDKNLSVKEYKNLDNPRK